MKIMDTIRSIITALCLSSFVIHIGCNPITDEKYPDIGLSVKQVVEKYGYPFESHTLVTKDGYILELHRIPYGRNSINYNKGPPILLVHGLATSASIWVNMGPDKSIGFILADKGYDVWLANCRGTTWSRKHITLDPDKDKRLFWNFSFQEIGYYDLPAFIDYVLHETNNEKLFYLGHSQGTTSFFLMGSERPEYIKKIKLMVALAPVAYLGHTTSSVLKIFMSFNGMLEDFINANQFYSVEKLVGMVGPWVQNWYSDDSPMQEASMIILYLSLGYSVNQFNKTMLPVVANNMLSGASSKQFLHYLQLASSGNFQKFDYGNQENLRRYGQLRPPKYDLHRVNTPVAAYYGTEDIFCAPEDMERTLSELPNVAKVKLIEGFNHVDVIWGADAMELVIDDFINLLNGY